jgi:hypothetical protein
MTQDEILETLHRVVQENKHYTTWTVSTPHLIALVREVIEQEREECAKLCFEMWERWMDADLSERDNLPRDAEDCANAIRARNTQ